MQLLTMKQRSPAALEFPVYKPAIVLAPPLAPPASLETKAAMAPDLDPLVVQAQAGDQAALDQALRLALPKLQVAVTVRCPDPLLAEEVVQETLVTAIQQISRYRPEGTFIAWLKGIARNHLYEQLRIQARFTGDELASVLATATLQRLDAGDAWSVAEDEHQERAALEHCLGRLSERLRTMVMRRHLDDLPLERLAQQFKQSTGSIAALLKRVRAQLRDCLNGKLSSQP